MATEELNIIARDERYNFYKDIQPYLVQESKMRYAIRVDLNPVENSYTFRERQNLASFEDVVLSFFLSLDTQALLPPYAQIIARKNGEKFFFVELDKNAQMSYMRIYYNDHDMTENFHFFEGRLHREDGPAVMRVIVKDTYYKITESEWWINGERDMSRHYNIEIQQTGKNSHFEDFNNHLRVNKKGLLDNTFSLDSTVNTIITVNTESPAYIDSKGNFVYFKDGLMHRNITDGPAFNLYSGESLFYVEGAEVNDQEESSTNDRGKSIFSSFAFAHRVIPKVINARQRYNKDKIFRYDIGNIKEHHLMLPTLYRSNGK